MNVADGNLDARGLTALARLLRIRHAIDDEVARLIAGHHPRQPRRGRRSGDLRHQAGSLIGDSRLRRSVRIGQSRGTDGEREGLLERDWSSHGTAQLRLVPRVDGPEAPVGAQGSSLAVRDPRSTSSTSPHSGQPWLTAASGSASPQVSGRGTGSRTRFTRMPDRPIWSSPRHSGVSCASSDIDLSR